MAGKLVTLIGTYPPRRCGIATFTEDLAQALAPLGHDVRVFAMDDGQAPAGQVYSPRVVATIAHGDLASYEAAADEINAQNCAFVCVQHEFGIFGGADGSYLLTLLRRLRSPIVTTLHTVLERFKPGQTEVIEELAALSTKLVVMSKRASTFLVEQGVPGAKIIFVPHGIPDIAADRETAKARLGVTGRPLILTFGLLSPNKGIETAIRALPALVQYRPDALYLILGATHPHVRLQHGEAYRESLVALAAGLGLAGNVRFVDAYSDLDGITRAIAAADICLLPYTSREQITSGTLAYAVGNGKAVVSTPFWHAEELLADGRGKLTPFGDHEAMGIALRDLFCRPGLRAEIERHARTFGAEMHWPAVARRYSDVFDAAGARPQPAGTRATLPAVTLDHVVALMDDTGLLQHAVIAVPNLREGYTTDDNARALQLASLLSDDPRAMDIARRTLAFLHHALNPVTCRFHNFMAYDRRWLDDDGGDNAQARVFRALVAASGHLGGALGATALELLARALPAVAELVAPRAQAIVLVAFADLANERAAGGIGLTRDMRTLADRYAENLMRLHAETATPSWPWFEHALSYSNAKLPHGLLAYGHAFGEAGATKLGLEALLWLEVQQTAVGGAFLPIGCERVYASGKARPLWDGQAIEAYATVSAALAAHTIAGDAAWLHSARRALDWLFGRNALGLPLYDPETGGCHDGLHRDRLNANQGAESTLALWLSLAEYERVTIPARSRRSTVKL